MNNVLVGKTITAVYLEVAGKAISFHIKDDEPIVAYVEGDCCSVTWIESLDAPDALIGTVISVENISMPDLGTEAEQTQDKDRRYDDKCISYYGCKITTDNGSCIIDYRNESNGYYGGSLLWPGSDFYEGVFLQNLPSETFFRIAGDGPEKIKDAMTSCLNRRRYQ